MSQQHLQPHDEDHLVALGRVLQILREEENADVLIETTLNYLKTEFDYHLIWIGLYDRLEHRLLGKGGTTPSGDSAFLRQRFNLTSGDLLEQVVIQQRLVGIPDLRNELRAGEWRRMAQEFGIQGTLIYPLRCKDRCFGVTLLGSQQWGVSPRPAEKAQLSLLLGGLAAALYQIEVDWQRLSTKHADQSLFQTLDQITQLPLLTQRLEAVVTMTQQFVAPTRTNLYWYSAERRYFWHRVGNWQSVRRIGESRSSSAGLTVAEANDFYQALATGQLVTIGAGRSLLSSETTEHLIKRLRSRSLLAAPIQFKGELLGFLAVEDNEPRIWEEAQTNYVRAMAQLLALVVGTEHIEATLEQTQKDTQFVAEIAQALRQMTASNDATAALSECAELLCKRFDTERFLVLQEEDNGEFTPVYGTQPLNRRPLTTPLAPMLENERGLLFKSTEALAIEDLDKDSRLFQWRETLSQLGVRSLLVYPMFNIGNSDKLSLLVIGHGIPRTWNPIERELLRIVSQQMNLLLTVDSHSESAKQAFFAHQSLTTGLSTLSEASQDPVRLERTWLQYLATLLECPLAALISWTPESPQATITVAVVADPSFALPPDLPLPVAREPLIQEALATKGFLQRSVTDLTATTRKWLSSPGIGQILGIALHTGATPTTAIILLADHEQRRWPSHLLPSLETLTTQFAWFRHYRYYLSRYQEEGKNLQTLNWYKHRCLEILHQSCLENVNALLEFEAQLLPSPTTGESNPANSLTSGPSNSKPLPLAQPLQRMRRQHLLHQLEKTLALLTPILTEEQWQLTANPGVLSLTSLLKRSLRRVEPLYKKRQLMLKIHNPVNKSVCGDRLKLECILFELLITSCVRAQPGSWINLWCCPVELKVNKLNVEGLEDNLQPVTPTQPSTPLLELLIAENGLLDECLQAFTSSRSMPPPSLNLKICQQILRSWGGDLQFYPLQADRYSSRLLLPLAK